MNPGNSKHKYLHLIFKGQDSVRTSLTEKVPPTLHGKELMEFFHIAKIARFW